MTVQPWERQPNESAKAFQAFDLYLQRGTERSIRKVAAELNKSVALCARWSRRHGWVERAREYDVFLAAEKARALVAREVDSRLRRARHGELIESTGTRAIQQIAAQVLAGTRELTVTEAAQLAAVGSRMDREAVQSAPGVTVNVGVNVAPSDQLDPDVDDETACKIAVTFLQRYRAKHGDKLPPIHQQQSLTPAEQASEFERAIRAGGV
jgi:hypothetical protein